MQRLTATRWCVPALVLVLLVLAACGAQSAIAPDEGESALGRDGGGVERPVDEAEGGGAGGGEPVGEDGDGGNFAPIEQRIVKTGEITLEVANVAEMLGRVRSLIAELDGYVGGSQAGTLEDRATLTVRIPAPAFDTALARLHELGAEVVAESTREQDVTGQVVDLAARIENLRASEASYRELIARAEEVEDILAVQARLDAVRGEIEQLQAQLDALEGQADLSTLTITLVPRAEPITEQAETWDPGAQLDRALASLVGFGQGLADGLIWFVVVWLPVLLVLALLVLVLLRGVLELRRRLPPATGTPAAAAGAADDGGAR